MAGSGKNVNARTAIQVSAVSACVRVIAETVASLPFAVFEQDKQGSQKALDTTSPKCSLQRIVNKQKKQVRNIETGEVFSSISDAEAHYGKPKNTSISCCCRGKFKTAYGYHWEFVKE